MWVAQDQIGRLNKTKNGTCLLTHIFVLCTQNPSHFFFLPVFSFFFLFISTDYWQQELSITVILLSTGSWAACSGTQILEEQKLTKFHKPLKGLITSSFLQTCSD